MSIFSIIVITSLRSGIEGSNAPVPVDVCRRRYTLLTFAAYIINVIGNANLMRRGISVRPTGKTKNSFSSAYILNMRSRKILVFLSVLVMAEYGTAAVLGASTMKTFVFDRRCNVTNVPWTIFIAM